MAQHSKKLSRSCVRWRGLLGYGYAAYRMGKYTFWLASRVYICQLRSVPLARVPQDLFCVRVRVRCGVRHLCFVANVSARRAIIDNYSTGSEGASSSVVWLWFLGLVYRAFGALVHFVACSAKC